MEGIQTIQALKAVQSSLPAQTTIPSDELVMLYATDGTPIAKISRDDLVKAVASVMASNSQNTFSKLLGVQANGTPMGIGASDLASVLGVTYIYHMNDISNSFDNPPFEGRKVSIGIYDESSTHNLTGNYSGLLISFKTYSGLNSSVKTASVIELNINISAYADGPDITSLVSATKIRYKNGESGIWSAWV